MRVTMHALKRFWSKVDKAGPVPEHCPELGPCWTWTAGSFRGGYGGFYLAGKMLRAHRVAWAIVHGAIPDGMCVLHKCDNRLCVRDSHHFLGDWQDNSDDMWSKGRGVPPRVAGDCHYAAKLSAGTVEECRRRYAAGGVSFQAMADEHRVSKTTMHRAVREKTWKGEVST